MPLNLIGDFGGAAMHPGVRCARSAARCFARRKRPGGANQHRRRVDRADPHVAGHASGRCLVGGSRGQCARWRRSHFIAVTPPRTTDTVAVGAIEAKFYRALLEGLGILDQVSPDDQMDRAKWPATAGILGARFAATTQAQWCDVFAGTDACVTPVLEPGRSTRIFPACRERPFRRRWRPVASGAPTGAVAHSQPGHRPGSGARPRYCRPASRTRLQRRRRDIVQATRHRKGALRPGPRGIPIHDQ